MDNTVRNLGERILDELATICLQALKEKGGLYPTEQEYTAIHEAIAEALRNKVRI